MPLLLRLLRLSPALLLAGFAAAQRTPDEALHALQQGNHRFAADRSVGQPGGEGVRRTLARGQSPFAVVVCCSDARVPPEHVFNVGLGELIVVRVGGHVVDREVVAAVEHAVEQLQVPLCVVLGHEQCDVAAAALQRAEHAHPRSEHGAAVARLLERLEPAVRKAQQRDLGGRDLRAAVEEEHAHETVHELLRRSELLRRYASVGRFRAVAARYRMQGGSVEWLPHRPLPAEPSAEQVALESVPPALPPHVALRLLQSGHRRFLADTRPAPDLGATRREALLHGAQPLAVVLTCTDSRVVPEHVFDVGLGELAVVRLPAGVLSEDALATVELAAARAGAPLLLVMAHSDCEAFAEAADGPERKSLTPARRELLRLLEPATERARGHAGRDLLQAAAQAQALRTLAEARQRSRVVRELEAAGRFAMLACVYDLRSGDLHWLPDAAPSAVRSGAAAAHGDGHAAQQPLAHEHGAQAKSPHGSNAAPDAHAQKAHGGSGAHEHHGADAHGAHAHTQPDAGHDAHGHAAAPSGHGEHAAANDHLPLLDWADAPHPASRHDAPAHAAPGGETRHGAHDDPHGGHGAGAGDPHADSAHAQSAHHGAADGHDAHHDSSPHDSAHHDSAHHADPHAAHADHGEANGAHHPRHPLADPVVLLGIAGVLSLLVAAVIAVRTRN